MNPPAPTSTTAPDKKTAAVSAKRREAVDRARQGWTRRLIDLSRRNNLLYYRPLKTGTLDLSSADPAQVAVLLSGAESVALGKLFPDRRDESLTNLVRDIARRAQANAEEKGLQTLFVAVGMATWPADDGGRPADAPVLLFPAALETKGAQSFSISRAGAVQVNLVLLHVLETQFGVKLSSDELIPHLPGADEGESFDPDPFYRELCQRVTEVRGFEVRPSAILGNFAFQKMAMVKDLQERGTELAEHDLVAAVAGDNDARCAISASQQDFDPRKLDGVPPDNEFIVFDADSSQQCAIASIMAGQSAVVHGPPGTGKSQTIANLVAVMAATGHRVLFVAEKRAALEVVLRRLKSVGLDHLAIDLHGADLSPRKVMQQVAGALDKVRNAVPVECENVHKQLVDRRTRLNEHVKRVHSRREPTGLSIYSMQGQLLRLGSAASTTTRWRGDELNSIRADVAEQVRDLLAEAAAFESLFLRTDPSPWTGAKLASGSVVERAIELVSGANAKTFPAFIESLQVILEQSRLRFPVSLGAARGLVAVVAAVQETLTAYGNEIYTQDLVFLLRDLQARKSGGLSGVWAWFVNPAYRRARKIVRALRTAAPVPVATLIAELKEAQRQAEYWKELAESGSAPCQVSGYAAHKNTCDVLFGDVDELASILPYTQIDNLTLAELGTLLRRLAADTARNSETEHNRSGA